MPNKSDFESINEVLKTGTFPSIVLLIVSIQRKTWNEIADEAYMAATSGTLSSDYSPFFVDLFFEMFFSTQFLKLSRIESTSSLFDFI